MPDHPVVSRDEWRTAREDLLQREKEHTRMADELARQRRELPWVQIEKEYEFETDDGTKTLTELFDGRSQLLLYHFMFGPSYEAGCRTCSSSADGVNGVLPHLKACDVTLTFVSRAPLERLQDYKDRMDWQVPWASVSNSDFNFDFNASRPEEAVREFIGPIRDQLPPVAEKNAKASGTDIVGYLTEGPALNAFVRSDGAVYQTYSTEGRGLECLMAYYPILDRTPRGRQEEEGFQLWLRRHDEY